VSQSSRTAIFPPVSQGGSLRVVVVGAGRRHKNERAIARAAAALGHPVRLVDVVTWTQNLGRLALPLLERRIASFEPEALVCTRHAIRLGEERLRRLLRGRYSAFWYFDLRVPPLPDVVRLGRLVDTMYTTCLPETATYRSAGVDRVLYLPQAMDPEVDRPAARVPRQYRCEVAFIGNGHHRHRVELLRSPGGGRGGRELEDVLRRRRDEPGRRGPRVAPARHEA